MRQVLFYLLHYQPTVGKSKSLEMLLILLTCNYAFFCPQIIEMFYGIIHSVISTIFSSMTYAAFLPKVRHHFLLVKKSISSAILHVHWSHTYRYVNKCQSLFFIIIVWNELHILFPRSHLVQKQWDMWKELSRIQFAVPVFHSHGHKEDYHISIH